MNKISDMALYVSDGTLPEIIDRYSSLPSIAEERDFGVYDRNVVVIDTETTGVSFAHDELTQIAAARLEKGEITEWFVTFVNPGKPISEEISHLTNIFDKDVADAPTPQESLCDLVEFVGDAKLVAHNAEFDRTFVTRHPQGEALLNNEWIDSLELARIALPRMKSHRLIDLICAFHGPLSTHRADDDVTATCALYRFLLAGITTMPQMLLEAIADMAPAELWPTVEIFKYFSEKQWGTGVGLGSKKLSLRALRHDRLDNSRRTAKLDAEKIAAGEYAQGEGEHPHPYLEFPQEAEIAEAFSEQGLMGSLYDDYEARDEQLVLATAVTKAFSQSTELVAEAGTGVGKSMAYLLPAALTALKNNITIGVATKTNALLDQLVYHELPLLKEALLKQGYEIPLDYVPLKGFSHYPCLFKIQRMVDEGPGLREFNKQMLTQAPALAGLLSFIEQTRYEDLDTLRVDFRLLPRWMMTTTSHECLRNKCPFFGQQCYVFGRRKEAESSHIVVTNHSLLFCDLAADNALLPPIRYWVVDEAHGAEKEARHAFSLELDTAALLRLAKKVSGSESSRGLFTRAERQAVATQSEQGTTLFYGLTNKARSAGQDFSKEVEIFSAAIPDLLYFESRQRTSKSYETVELWLNDEIRASEKFRAIAELGKRLVEKAEALVRACQDIVAYLEDVEGCAPIQREIASVALELKDVINAADVILFSQSERYVYSAILNKKKDKEANKLLALLFNVGQTLDETLYAQTHSVVYTSATLAIDGKFTAFEQAMGLGGQAGVPTNELLLDSSYDFDNHMRIFVLTDMPEPNDPGYLAALQRLLIAAHKAQQGSMLTLFTNRREMESCYDVVKAALKEDDLRVLCQKWGLTVKGLRDEFIADEHLSLFALKSFWEGFDAPGATLKGVIIPKLPFALPTDPLSCERSAREDGAWSKYVLPAAVMETKQAAGRLIRKADDEGAVILADRRLISKGYGKTFLRSLPSRNITQCTIDELAQYLSPSTTI